MKLKTNAEYIFKEFKPKTDFFKGKLKILKGN